MSLDLVDIPSQIERSDCADAGMEVYRLLAAHPAFQYVSHVSMSIEAMSRTICQLKDVALPDDGFLGLAAVGFSGIFRVEQHGLVDAALNEVAAESLWAPIEWRVHGTRHERWASALRPWLRYTLRVGFIDLFETNKALIGRRGGMAGKLAKIVRDSCAHGGRIQSNYLQDPVSFHGIDVVRESHGKALEDVFDFGDYLILALAMFGQADGAGNRRST